MYQRNIVAETAGLCQQFWPRSAEIVDLSQLSDEEIDCGVHCMSDDERYAATDPMTLFATRMKMA